MARQIPVINGAIVQSTSESSASSIVERDSNSDARAARWTSVTSVVSEGGLKANLVSKTTAYTATESDFTINCDASGGAFSVTLPAAASSNEMILVIKNIGASGTVTIDGNASEVIDGATTVALTAQWSFRMIHCNGTAWFVIGS